ncbi:hypothetical protein ILUMI_01036 [Ignelater luminosus]|uniref:Uncharacterized protein n=1 Tax=Ignelater luminosus TaxID=2038154 RepID=A0A8K0DJ39_IGNLU|nr:hypothetical protein ILUMI_01036 [Ignelater luminosus]
MLSPYPGPSGIRGAEVSGPGRHFADHFVYVRESQYRSSRQNVRLLLAVISTQLLNSECHPVQVPDLRDSSSKAKQYFDTCLLRSQSFMVYLAKLRSDFGRQLEVENAKLEANITRAGRHIWKMGLWNVHKMNGKENELAEEFEKNKLKILELMRQTKKGNESESKQDYLYLYNSAEKQKRAKTGIAESIKKKLEKLVDSWHPVNGRLIIVEMQIKNAKDAATEGKD